MHRPEHVSDTGALAPPRPARAARPRARRAPAIGRRWSSAAPRARTPSCTTRAARLASALAADGVRARRPRRAAAAQRVRVPRVAARVPPDRGVRRADQLPPRGGRDRLHPRGLRRRRPDRRRPAGRPGPPPSSSRSAPPYEAAIAASRAGAAGRRPRTRPGVALLHVGHHRAAEGRGPQPREPRGHHAELDPRDAAPAPTTSGSRASRCSTSAASTACCRSWRSAPPASSLPTTGFDPARADPADRGARA